MPQSGLSATPRRLDNLALAFQEVLTAIVRLRSNRQAVSDAESFRLHIREALKTAAQDARGRGGYSGEDVRLATFAIVGFLDESILNSRNPLFADWPRKPLQEELFGTHMAGEVFFQNVQQLLARADSEDLADVLEVHYLCLLLGYVGRYSAGSRGELTGIMAAIAEKIRRIRGHSGELSPSWMLPAEAALPARDRWTRPLMFAALGCVIALILLFTGLKFALASGAGDLAAIAIHGRN